MATSREARKTRTSVRDGFRRRLNVENKDPDYEYYIVTDKDGRVEQAEALGFIKDTDKNIRIGDRKVGLPTEDGSIRTVSVGGGEVGVLMKIKKELWAELQDEKNAKAESAVKQTLQDAGVSTDYGKITLGRSS